LAAGHHNPETPLQWVIAMADRFASGWDRDKFEAYNATPISFKDYRRTRLLTLFEQISINDRQRDDSLESYFYRYPLKELSPVNIFPEKKDKEEIRREEAEREYKKLLENFIFSMERLEHKNNVRLWFEHFDTLFMIYASYIPAATVGNVIPDVSLYDHSKITSALATAIYLYHLEDNSLDITRIKDYEDNKFLIITGDFYGIQEFIFSEGGSTNKAGAKLLRGRSFAVSLISELAADLLCREIGLPTTSILLNAAGKFTIIAPNTIPTKEKIKRVEEKVNDWLIKIAYGETTMGITCVEACGNDLTPARFSNLLDKFQQLSSEKKFKKIDLDRYGGAIEGYLDAFNNELDKKLCPFCGKRPSDERAENDSLLVDEISACSICRDHIYIGTNMVKESRLAITTIDAELHGDKLLEPIFGKYQVSFDVDGKLSKLANQDKLLRYWDIDIPEDEGTMTLQKGKESIITLKFINGYCPKYSERDKDILDRLLYGNKTKKKQEELFNMIDNGLPKSFNHIANMALNPAEKKKFCGISTLGVLKADVDHLGLIFAFGLKDKRQTFSRYAALSRQMNNFFSLYLPYLLYKEERFQDTYTLFAGGDDLFLIGPWNRIIDLAISINNKFREYVCANRDITISAGIGINRPGEPVAMIAERAEQALKKAKVNRNSITLFGEATGWDRFIKLNEIKSIIDNWLDNAKINNAMLYRFNDLMYQSQEAEELIKEDISLQDIDPLLWRARFKYSLIRNIGKGLKQDERERVIEEVEEVADWLYKYKGRFKVALWQVIYNRR
ncbi:MAG: type III-A CRISPR-associated protein Cas10/Csm1, partial [Nitrospirota bacterium]